MTPRDKLAQLLRLSGLLTVGEAYELADTLQAAGYEKREDKGNGEKETGH